MNVEILKTKSKLKLSSTLDANIVPSLKESLLTMIHENKPIEIDASTVQSIDTLCSQMLLSASRTCHDQEISFHVVKQSQKFIDVMKLLDMTELLEDAA